MTALGSPGRAGDAPLLDRLAELVDRELGARPDGIEEIHPGLGTRRFFRLALPARARNRRAIARVEGPEDPAARRLGIPAEPPLEPIRGFLEAHGLPVPARLGGDRQAGIDLLEDLGDCSLEQAATGLGPERRRALYADACGLLPRLQRLVAAPAEVAAFGRRLDAPLIATKATKFIEWSLPWALGRPASAAEQEAVTRAFAWIAAECEAAPARLSHRDFKAANLHLRVRADGSHELVMIDLQGAFLAPPEYDLVCLLRDSHVALPETEVTWQLAAIRPRLPDLPDAASFARRFTLLTLTRVGKDLSHYLHAADSRGDHRYLRFVPNAVTNLQRAAAEAAAWHPLLADLAEIVARLPSSSADLEARP